MTIALISAAVCVILVVLNLVSMAIAGRRWTRPPRPAPKHRPPVSIIRPLCGLETFSAETLASSFNVDWPEYELIFCVQRPNDPIIPLVRSTLAAHPQFPAQLLIGDDPISANPKLNNCIKGWLAAKYDWIVMADSNVLIPRNYLDRMFSVVTPASGLIVSMPLGTQPKGFFAELECAILNTFQARWQYAAEAVGLGFAQGKNMLWRREVLERAGGIAALAAEIAEDAASTKIVRAQGLNVHLVDMPFDQPLGERTAKGVWSRHARWALLRRVTFPLEFTPEILTGSVAPLLAGAIAAKCFDVSMPLTLLSIALLLYGSELILTAVSGFPLSWRTPFAFILRDLWLPAMWFDALASDDYTWHGTQVNVRESSAEAPPEAT